MTWAHQAVEAYLARELPGLHPREGIAADIVLALTEVAVRHPDEPLPWDDYADESTLTRPLYRRKTPKEIDDRPRP